MLLLRGCLTPASLLLRNLVDILCLLLLNYKVLPLGIHHNLLLRGQVVVTTVWYPLQHNLLLLRRLLLLLALLLLSAGLL